MHEIHSILIMRRQLSDDWGLDDSYSFFLVGALRDDFASDNCKAEVLLKAVRIKGQKTLQYSLVLVGKQLTRLDLQLKDPRL